MSDKKIDIGIHIGSDLDPKGIDAANKKLDEAAKKGGATGKSVEGSMKKAQGALGGVGEAARGVFGKLETAGVEACGKVQRALGFLGAAVGGFGLLALINGTITLVTELGKLWDSLTKKFEDAGQKLKRYWEEQKNIADAARAREGELHRLESERDMHKEILDLMKQKAAFEAQMRELEARRKGDELGAQRAVLEGQYARGEISKAEWVKGVRELEDKDREGKQGKETAAAQAEVDQTTTALAQANAEFDKASKLLQEFNKEMTAYTDQRKHGVGEEGFVATVQEAAQALESALSLKKEVDEGILTSWASKEDEQRNKDTIQAKRAQLESTAQALNVATRKYDTNKGEWVDKTPKELAEDIIAAEKELRAARAKDANEAKDKQTAAETAAQQAKDKKDALDKAHEAQNEAVATKRKEEDKTAANRAAKAAQEQSKAVEEMNRQTDKARQAEELQKQKKAADTEKKAADDNLKLLEDFVKQWWETNKEGLKKRADQTPNSPFAQQFKQLEGLMGKGDWAGLASLVEHTGIGGDDLRRRLGMLGEAQGRQQAAQGQVDAVAKADEATREIDAALGEQATQKGNMDKLVEALKQMIADRRASGDNADDETYQQLETLMQEVLADGQVTDEEGAKLTQALGALSDASSAQGQKFVGIVQDAVTGLNNAATRYNELSGKVDALRKDLNEAQRKLAKKE